MVSRKARQICRKRPMYLIIQLIATDTGPFTCLSIPVVVDMYTSIILVRQLFRQGATGPVVRCVAYKSKYINAMPSPTGVTMVLEAQGNCPHGRNRYASLFAVSCQ
jgi:hypothetical protein